jgi:hypothetical protein
VKERDVNTTPDYSHDPRALALFEVLRVWIFNNQNWSRDIDKQGWWHLRRAEDIAVDLLPALEGMDVRLAGALESPDGELIRNVVWCVLPPQEAAMIDLLSDAVLLAAQAQNKSQKVQAGMLAGAGALILLGILSAVGDSQ